MAEQIHLEHADIIRRGLETRVDMYKLGFFIVQILALVWLMFRVQDRYTQLTKRFIA